MLRCSAHSTHLYRQSRKVSPFFIWLCSYFNKGGLTSEVIHYLQNFTRKHRQAFSLVLHPASWQYWRLSRMPRSPLQWHLTAEWTKKASIKISRKKKKSRKSRIQQLVNSSKMYTCLLTLSLCTQQDYKNAKLQHNLLGKIWLALCVLIFLFGFFFSLPKRYKSFLGHWIFIPFFFLERVRRLKYNNKHST